MDVEKQLKEQKAGEKWNVQKTPLQSVSQESEEIFRRKDGDVGLIYPH